MSVSSLYGFRGALTVHEPRSVAPVDMTHGDVTHGDSDPLCISVMMCAPEVGVQYLGGSVRFVSDL
ncbi:MAG: hypothetical protein GXP36_04670 [Actinobacteria bacterium]|nr:hypothetical protein [Actinomycetota bacterium]